MSVDNPLRSIPHKKALNKRKQKGRTKRAKPVSVSKTKPLKTRLKRKMLRANTAPLPISKEKTPAPGNSKTSIIPTSSKKAPRIKPPKNIQLSNIKRRVLSETTFKQFPRKPHIPLSKNF
jgi:hypothetical protein